MSTEVIQANKNWLVWARESVNYDKKTVAQKMKIKEEILDNWEKTGQLEYANIIELSKIYHITPHMFFNGKDPKPEEKPVDFRTIKNKKAELTPDIVFELRNAKNKRETLLDIEEDDDDFKIPEFKLKDYSCRTEEDAIDIINNALGMSNAKRTTHKLDYWIKKIEELGVLVFQFYGIPPEELRGYTIYYDKLPIIGINHREKETARKFTLFHELAHLLFKEEGLSNFSSYYLNNKIEVMCNAVSGEILVPSQDIDYIVKSENIKDFTNPNLIKTLSGKYKVSDEVIVRKFLIQNYISSKDYETYKEDLNKYIFQKTSTKRRKKSKSTEKTDSSKKIEDKRLRSNERKAKQFITQNGDFYTNALIYAYMNNIITDLDFARHLDTSINVVKLIVRIMNKRSQ